MKLHFLLLTLLFFICCNDKADEERIIIDIENMLPGTWKVVKLNNITSDSLNFQDAYFEEGSHLEDFGIITIPDFILEYNDNNFITIILISCEFTLGEFNYPFFLTNQTLITGENSEIFQCELLPDNSIEISGDNKEVEEIINNFKIFHTYYEIDIKSSDSINLISRYRETEVIMNLVRV